MVLARWGIAVASVVGLGAPIAVAGEITFEDVTERAGIAYAGPTYGASWGDFDGDGWPDLWVSNHADRPSLYLNNGDGTFTDIAPEVWRGNDHDDTHGAAWADFDNDGDQDLIETVGALIGTGSGPNHLFVSTGGRLQDRAAALGVEDRLGRGRTPLWLDWNGDGLLDLLLANAKREDVSSALFVQTADGFKEASNAAGFQMTTSGRWTTQLFAQLSDLSGDDQLDLVVHGESIYPWRVYDLGAVPFSDVTERLGMPGVSAVKDAAIADFNSDLRPDLYLARSRDFPDAVRMAANKVAAHLRVGQSRSGISFKTGGDVTFDVYPRGILRDVKEEIFIGSGGKHPEHLPFTLSPQDPTVFWADMPDGDYPCQVPRSWNDHVRRAWRFACKKIHGLVADDLAGIFIGFDPNSRVWKVVHAYLRERNVLVETDQPIFDLTTHGFSTSERPLEDRLLVRTNDGFEDRTVSAGLDALTSCSSVVAGDFDNDMDQDLYLVCAEPIRNVPNILYQNRGDGSFAAVEQAGGAEGSVLGRGETVVAADYDRDGFLDLFVTNGFWSHPFDYDGPHQLFRNLGNDNHWLEIDLVGVVSNRDGIGAHVVATAGDDAQLREQGGGMHRFAQSHQRIHFGLGRHTVVDRLTVRWSSGVIQELEDVPVDQILEIVEPSEAARSD